MEFDACYTICLSDTFCDLAQHVNNLGSYRAVLAAIVPTN